MAATVFKRPAGSFYIRLFLSRREIWTSLRTKDPCIARLRGAVLTGRIASATLLSEGYMTRENMKQIVKQFVREIIQRGEEDRASRTKIMESERQATDLGLSDCFDAANDQLRTNDLTAIAPTVDGLLRTHGLSIEKDSTEYRVFSRLVLSGYMAALKVEGERWREGDERVEGLTLEETALGGDSQNTESDSRPLAVPVTQVITAYFKENKREPRTDSQIKSGFDKFMKVIGGDCPIGAITKEKCRPYKEGMATQGLSVASVNKYLHGLSHLLAWAKGQGYLPDSWVNPVDGLRIKKHRGEKRLKRSPFSDEELTAIFDSRDFTKEKDKHPERYWLPLCLLWSGARREEIAQLYLDDVKQVEAVWVFDIKTDEKRGQGLKNEASVRMVPVHSRLIELGLLQYVNQTRATGALRLFPRLKHGGNGFGDSVGKESGGLNDLRLSNFSHQFPSTAIHM